jgi:hypothetical protein
MVLCYAASGQAEFQMYVWPRPHSDFYTALSDKSKGTVTIHYKNQGWYTPLQTNPCFATFKLLTGYAFDLSPPVGAKCPSNFVASSVNGRTFCAFCTQGSYKGTKGVCDPCPGGTYQDLEASTKCKACPAGSYCKGGTAMPEPCSPGSYSSKAAAASCALCPKNTFASSAGAKKCAKCPALSKSAPGSQACGVRW